MIKNHVSFTDSKSSSNASSENWIELRRWGPLARGFFTTLSAKRELLLLSVVPEAQMEAQNYCQYDEQERRTRKRETGGTFSPTTKKRAELRAICWESAFYSCTDCIVHNHRLSKTIISSCHYSLTIRARNVQVHTNKRRSRERKDCQRVIRPSSSSSPIERYIEQHRRFTVIFYRPWRPLNVKARWKSGGRQDLYPRGESNTLLPGDIYIPGFGETFLPRLFADRKFFFESSFSKVFKSYVYL